MPTTMTQFGEVTALSVKGELNMEEVDSFKNKAAAGLSEQGAHFVVDFTQTEGFDSAGLESLVELQSQCEEKMGALKLCGLDQTCSKILEITRLTRRFEIYDDLESAVKSFN